MSKSVFLLVETAKLGFCWYPSRLGLSLDDAIQREGIRFGIKKDLFEILAADCSIAVELLRAGKLRPNRDFRRIVQASPLPLMEIRIQLPLADQVSQVRLYFCPLESQQLAIGLAIRFKRLAGSRQQIRIWQNEDISLAIEVQKYAADENFQKCLAKGE